LCIKAARSMEQLDPSALDLLQLAQLAGLAANHAVRARLEAKGFVGLRDSHGFIVQHLLRGPQSISELAAHLGITQQAVSKSVAELGRNGYVQDVRSDDARVRKLRLSPRGRAAVRAVRAYRRELDTELSADAGETAYAHAKQVLLAALARLEALEPIRQRKVRP
jgi:DNA-binding MarR family transcriptional regulator